MIGPSHPIEPVAVPPGFSRSILDMAAEVEHAERDIKAALLAAIQAGDSAGAERIVTRWITLPAAEVLEKRLDP